MSLKKGVFKKSLLAMILSTTGVVSSNALCQVHTFNDIHHALSSLHFSKDSYPDFNEVKNVALKLLRESAPQGRPFEEMVELNKHHTTYYDALTYVINHQEDLPVKPLQTEKPWQEDVHADSSPEQSSNNQQIPVTETNQQPTASRKPLTPTENQASTLFSAGLNQTVSVFTTQSMSQHASAISSFITGQVLAEARLQDTETTELQASTGRMTNTFASPIREGGVYSYGQMYGFKMDQGRVDDTAGFNADGYGIEVGLLKQLTPEWTAGVMIGIQKMDSQFKESLAQLNAQSFRIGPFVAWNSGDWHLNGALTYGITRFNNKRTDPLDGTQYHSSLKSKEWTAYASTGYDFSLDDLLTGFILTPNVELIYIHNSVDSFREKGEGKRALKIEKQSSQGWVVRTGMNLIWALPDTECSKQLRAGLGYQNSFLKDSKISFGFANQSGIQSLKAGDYGRKSIYYNLGYSQHMKSDQNIHIDYFGSSGNKSQSHAIALTYEMKF
ncbi:hypothetical protein EOPP23_00395 [Endozoicomonas sp. OPT23]|uniref:autotransporter outer membrane beta-barrel domain-containing protein n=1 Tax=Endozoicomonas sp. OPT23 TaxID=2072845 RepID=UPI00129AB164|nr:autotransporter outer membrane beta-barrel domain-containing protein [Endozoicomonas sp. OPT23]MRI31448.1 hypothetical protein [Endozoicomonas sp. OPT23]